MLVLALSSASFVKTLATVDHHGAVHSNTTVINLYRLYRMYWVRCPTVVVFHYYVDDSTVPEYVLR